MSYVSVFEPKLEVRKALKLSFVPIIENPYYNSSVNTLSNYSGIEHIRKGDEQYRVRPYIDGMFVMRLRVNPIDPTTVYYYR